MARQSLLDRCSDVLNRPPSGQIAVTLSNGVAIILASLGLFVLLTRC